MPTYKTFYAVLSKVPQPATQTSYNGRMLLRDMIDEKTIKHCANNKNSTGKKGVTLCFVLLLLS